MSRLPYPCTVNVDLVLDTNSVRYIKRQATLHGSCPFFGLPLEAHDAMIKHGLVEGVHFSHDKSPLDPPVGRITYREGVWKEESYG